MARRQTLISEIANDARTARLEPTLMKGAATLEPQGVRFKRERERELTHRHQSCREKGLQPPPSVIFKTRSNLSFLNTLFLGVGFADDILQGNVSSPREGLECVSRLGCFTIIALKSVIVEDSLSLCGTSSFLLRFGLLTLEQCFSSALLPCSTAFADMFG